MSGRKRIDLEMQGTKGNRQRIWEALRARRDSFTAIQVACSAQVNEDTTRSYLNALMRGGWIEVSVGSEPFEEQILRLVRDTGAEAPAVTRAGTASTAGLGNEAMWRTLRILGEMNAAELAGHASASVTVTLWSARSYLKWLKRAGYVQVVQVGKPGRPERYRLTPGRYTGPRPPMIQRIGQVYDPNLGEVVYRAKPEEELA